MPQNNNFDINKKPESPSSFESSQNLSKLTADTKRYIGERIAAGDTTVENAALQYNVSKQLVRRYALKVRKKKLFTQNGPPTILDGESWATLNRKVAEDFGISKKVFKSQLQNEIKQTAVRRGYKGDISKVGWVSDSTVTRYHKQCQAAAASQAAKSGNDDSEQVFKYF